MCWLSAQTAAVLLFASVVRKQVCSGWQVGSAVVIDWMRHVMESSVECQSPRQPASSMRQRKTTQASSSAHHCSRINLQRTTRLELTQACMWCLPTLLLPLWQRHARCFLWLGLLQFGQLPGVFAAGHCDDVAPVCVLHLQLRDHQSRLFTLIHIVPQAYRKANNSLATTAAAQYNQSA